MNVLHFEKIDSTNKYIKENYESLEDFSFVSADEQTSGRGRMDRKWFSNKNENLLFSYLIKNEDLLCKYESISIGTATLIARFLELKGIKNVSVKWPNDVYVNDKKICGILLEGNIKKFLVVGVGLNVNQIDFDGEYRIAPTSMRLELQKEADLVTLNVELFEFIYKHIKQRDFALKTRKFLENHNYLLGKEVEINGVKGKVTGISKNFNLIVDSKEINSGEIEKI